MSAIRIGLLLPQEGPAGLWAPSAIACANLAAKEINERDGLLGRPMDLVLCNVGSTAASAAEAAGAAIDVEDVQAVVGMFPSYARASVSRAIGRRAPFIYTSMFEGFDDDPNVVTTGETAAYLLRPSLDWLIENRKARRFFLCGSDYLWPRSALMQARRYLRDMGAVVVGERFLPLEDHSYGELLDEIRASAADVVMPYFLGYDSVHFNRAFGETGLAKKMLRYASAIDETVLYNLDENATENLYVSSGYFSGMRSRNNGAFLERYHNLFGDSPPPVNTFGQSCYEGVHCLAALAETAGTLRTGEVLQRFGRSRVRTTARGTEPMPVTGSAPTVYLARVDGYDFTCLNPG